MENSLYPEPPLIIRCDGCYREVGNDDIYCVNCGYPIKGSASEQKAFISKEIKAEFDLVKFKKRANKAGNTLYYLAGLFLLGSITSFFKMKDDPDVLAIVIPNVILAVLFLLLGEYSKKKMLTCFISGLGLFIIIQILEILEDPYIIGLSYLVGVIIIMVLLLMGIKSAIEIEKIKKENNIT